MKIKLQLFKYTFIVLSIMCCLLLISTSILYAVNDFNIGNAEITGLQETAADTVSAGTGNTADGSDKPAASDSSTSAATAEPAAPSAETGENTDVAVQNVEPKAIIISAVGDIMAHQGNLNNAYSHATSTYDFNGFLEYVKPYLAKSDLTLGNLETVTAGPDSGFTSYPSFNTPDSILTALSAAGFDVLSTANNHSLDRGITGLERTIKKIHENKMLNVGSSIDGNNKYITKEINGIKVSVLSYSAFYNGNENRLTAAQKDRYLSPLDETQIQNDITAVKADSADIVIVYAHWGNEYHREASSTQISLTEKMFSWGADIVLGSHPHVIQKSDIVKVDGKDKFVIYSMGNFISGYRRIDKAKRPNKIYTEDGVIVQLEIEKTSDKGTLIKKVDYIPTWVDKYYVNNRPVFKVLPIFGENITGPFINEKNNEFIKQSYKNTMNIMAKMK